MALKFRRPSFAYIVLYATFGFVGFIFLDEYVWDRPMNIVNATGYALGIIIAGVILNIIARMIR